MGVLEPKSFGFNPRPTTSTNARKSITPAEATAPSQLPSRNRFGFGAPGAGAASGRISRQSNLPDAAPTPARPASALGLHQSTSQLSSVIPATHKRRSSSFSTLVGLVSTNAPPPVIPLAAVSTPCTTCATHAADTVIANDKLAELEVELTMSNNLVDSSLAETTLLKDAIASRDVKLALTSDLVATKEVELDGLRTQLAKRDQNSALVQTLIDAADLEIKSLKAKMTIREEDIIAVKSQSNASLDEIKSLKQKLSTKENQVLQFENDLLALSKTADADMAELKDTQSELENASRDSAGLVESTRAENQKAVKALREEKEGLGERIDVLAGVVQKKDKELDAMTEKYEVGLEELKQVQSSMSKIASAAKEAEVARTKEVESLRAELDTKSTQLDQFAEQRPEDSTAFLDLQAAHAELQSQLNIAESTSQSINAEKVSLHSLLNSSTAAVAQHVTTIASLTSDCVTLEQELTAARSDLEVARVESQTEIDSMQRELSESKAVVSQAVSEKERIEGELSEMSDKVSAGEQELIAARSLTTEQTTLLAGLELGSTSLDSEITSLRVSLATASSSLVTLQEEHDATLVNHTASLASLRSAHEIEIENLAQSQRDSLAATETTSITTLRDAHRVEVDALVTSHKAAIEESQQSLYDLTALLQKKDAALLESTHIAAAAQATIVNQAQEMEDAQELVREMVEEKNLLEQKLVHVEEESVEAMKQLVESEAMQAEQVEKIVELSQQLVELESIGRSSVEELESTIIAHDAALSTLQASHADLVLAEQGHVDTIVDLERRGEELANDNEALDSRVATLVEKLEVMESERAGFESKQVELADLVTKSRETVLELELQLSTATTIHSAPESTPADRTEEMDLELARHSVLVSRLREERAELNSRLEFLSAESTFTASSLSILLSTHAAALTDMQTTRDAAEYRANELAGIIGGLERTADAMQKELNDRERRIEEYVEMGVEAEALAGEYDELFERHESIIEELEMRRRDSDVLREELAAAHVTIDELEATLTTQQADYSASTIEITCLAQEISQLNELLDEATIRVEELEDQVADLQRAARRSAPRSASKIRPESEELLELREETAGLRDEVDDLKAKVMRRTEQIGHLSQQIEVFESRQSIEQAGFSQEDNDDTQILLPSSEILSVELSEAKSSLEEIRSTLADVEEELVIVTEARDRAELSLAEKQSELDSVSKQLVQIESSADELAQEKETLVSELAEVVASKDDVVERFASAKESAAMLKEELTFANSRLDDAITASAALESSLTILQSTLNASTEEWTSASTHQKSEIARLGEIVECKTKEYEAGQKEIETMQQRLAEMGQKTDEDTATRFSSVEAENVELQDRLERTLLDLADRTSAVESVTGELAMLQQSFAAVSAELTESKSTFSATQDALSLAQSSLVDLESAHVTALSEERSSSAEAQSRFDQELAKLSLDAEVLKSELQAGASRVEALEQDLAAKEIEMSKMDLAHVESKSLLDVATESVLALESTLRAATFEATEANNALAANSTAIEDLQSRLDVSELTKQSTTEEIARLEELIQRLEAESARVQADYQQKIISLDGEMEVVLVDLREKEVATLEELDELKKNSHLEQERLSNLLSTAQSELRLSTGELDESRQRLQSAEVEVEQLKKEMESVEEQLREEGVAAGAALTALEESATKEMERLTALAEHAGEEIEALKGENIGLESDLNAVVQDLAKGQEVQSAQARQLVELGRQRDSIEAERLSTLSRVSELVARIGELEAAVEEAAQHVGDEERVKELEKKLEAMSNDKEDTDDRYLEVLRNQKRNTNMIEHYKSKNLTLKKSLAAATLAAANSNVLPLPAPIAPPTPAPSTIVETVAPSSGKKRTRPVEPESNTAALPPRAIVAKVSLVAAKENIAIEKVASKESYTKSSSRDGIVALKPPAPTPVKRVPLSITSNNGINTTVLTSAAGATTKTGSLRERLEAMRGVRAPAE